LLSGSLRQFPNLGGGKDQSAELASLLPGYVPVFRPAIEAADDLGRYTGSET
jgi:hypothetical protein